MKFYSHQPVHSIFELIKMPVDTPEFLVVELGDAGVMFQETLSHVEYLIHDKDFIMEQIIGAITFRSNAELELSYLLLDEARKSPMIENVYLLNHFLNVCNAYGLVLIKTLEHLGVYNKGYLEYAFDSWNGPFLVLSKINLNEIKRDLSNDRVNILNKV